MKQFIIIIALLLSSSWLYAQDPKGLIHKGNELYTQKKYDEAADAYGKATDKKGALPLEGNFNLGDALYKQKKFDDAAQHFTDIGTSNASPAVKAKAYHNLGNSLLESKKYQESIDAYKKSLLNNPKDDQTRYNLAYAQEKLKQQQQQNKKNQNNKNNQQNKDQQKQNQDKKDQDKKNQNQKDKDKNKDNKDQNQGNKPQPKDQQDQGQPKPKPGGIPKQRLENLLDAVNNEEKKVQDKVNAKKVKGVQVQNEKDW